MFVAVNALCWFFLGGGLCQILCLVLLCIYHLFYYLVLFRYRFIIFLEYPSFHPFLLKANN